MENNCYDALMKVVKEQHKFGNKVSFFAFMAAVFGVSVTLKLKEQSEQIEKLKIELEDMKNKEE